MRPSSLQVVALVALVGLLAASCNEPVATAPVAPVEPHGVEIELLSLASATSDSSPTKEVTGYRLHAGSDGPYLTWLERSEATPRSPSDKTSEAAQTAARPWTPWTLRATQWVDDRWHDAHSIIGESTREHPFFANWADTPALIELKGGLFSSDQLLALWLEKLGDPTYAYGVQLALGGDPAQDWTSLGLLHDDTSLTEHGFVSLATRPDQPKSAWAVWLDGRQMQDEGPMSLRATTVGVNGPEQPSVLLDGRVCECCPTDIASTPDGPIAVYRNRSSQEVRDIWRVRWSSGRWGAPSPVHEDGWRINGCPVNGPAIATEGDHAVVVWYTGAAPRRRVLAAWSHDRGETFSDPVIVDQERPYGRVDVAFVDGIAWVSWMTTTVDGPAVLLQGISTPGEMALTAPRSPPLLLGSPQVLALTSAARKAGVPRLLAHGDGLFVAWVELGAKDETVLRTASIRFG